MRIAVAQLAGVPGDVEANVAAVRSWSAEAAAAGARLTVFPEAFLTGYDVPDRPELATDEVAAALAGLPTAVVVGFAERGGFNTAVLLERGGEVLGAYRKTHLYGSVDRASFVPGDALGAPVELDGVRVALLVCFDIEFPEPARALAARGAQLIVVPTSLMEPAHVVAEVLVPARAVENQVFVAYANRVGAEERLRYVGRSTIAGPDGVIAVADATSETLVVADVDPAAIARARSEYSYLDERRPELYD